MIKSLPNLYQFLELSEKEVEAIAGNLRHYYTLYRQPKKKHGEDQEESGRPRYRYLRVPDNRLKLIQRAIAGLLGKIELPAYMYGSVKGTNNIENAMYHLNQQFFLTLDLKNFFPNINHSQVFAMLRENGYSPSVARILTQLTTYNGSLPQGSPCSPIISNLVFRKAGNEIDAMARANGIKFTTFLDDLAFSAKNGFKKLIPGIIEIIKAHQFCINYDKIHYCLGSCEMTGLFVRGNILSLPYKMLLRARSNDCVNAYRILVEAYNQRIASANTIAR